MDIRKIIDKRLTSLKYVRLPYPYETWVPLYDYQVWQNKYSRSFAIVQNKMDGVYDSLIAGVSITFKERMNAPDVEAILLIKVTQNESEEPFVEYSGIDFTEEKLYFEVFNFLKGGR